MPFKKNTDGSIDPNINRDGRRPKKDKKTPRQIRNSELESLLRKIKPHVSKSIMTAVGIMDRVEDVSDASKLKAATIILDLYKDTVIKLYDGQDGETDEDLEEVEANKPFQVFSFDTEKKEDQSE